MRKIVMTTFIALFVPTSAISAAPKPVPQRSVVRPSIITPALQNKYENDLRAFSAWVQKLQVPEERFTQSIEKMWATFETHNKLAEKASDQELLRLFDTLIKNLGDIKSEVISANAELALIKPLTGNMVAAELPPGFLTKVISDTQAGGVQVLELIDRAETQATAMSLGETTLGEEFANLMADSSVAMVSSALSRSRSNAAINRKGTSNATRMMLLVSVQEAMEHLVKERRRVQKKEATFIDAAPAKASMARAVSASQTGLAQLKKEQAEAAKSAAAFGRDILDVIKFQNEMKASWFNHILGRGVFYTSIPDRIEIQGIDAKKYDDFIDGLIADEGKFNDLHQQALKGMAQ
jgi:hypothetical protein